MKERISTEEQMEQKLIKEFSDKIAVACIECSPNIVFARERMVAVAKGILKKLKRG